MFLTEALNRIISSDGRMLFSSHPNIVFHTFTAAQYSHISLAVLSVSVRPSLDYCS